MLDVVFRKCAWTANVALLLAAASLGATTLGTIAGVAIRPAPRADLAPASGPFPPPSEPVALDVDAIVRLFGQQPAAGLEEGADGAASPSCDDPGAAPARGDTGMRLVAGVVAASAPLSLATIWDRSTRETHVLGIGDGFGGMRLLAVQRVRDDHDQTGNGFRVVATLCTGGRKEYVELVPGVPTDDTGATTGVRAPPAPGPAGLAAGAPVQGVRKLGPNRYELDRSVVEKIFDLDVATQARIVPSFRNGVADGLRVLSVKPGSLYASIGIENGDVVQRVNGYEIDSPGKALELYQKLGQWNHVTIDLERGGQTIRIDYLVR